MPQNPSVKAFLSSTAGKITLTAVAVLALVGSFLELGVLIAIATFLLVLLAVPIYLGWRRPRELALAAFVAILIAAPLTTLVYTNDIRSPVGSYSSPDMNGGPVLKAAHVTPFAAAQGSTFDFQVTVQPQFLPNGSHGPEYVIVYLSTCAGATTANVTACGGGGYPFWQLNHTFATALNTTTDVTVSQTLHMANLWWWLMAFVYQNATNVTQWTWVGISDTGSGIQGPVYGDFTSTFVLILPALIEAFLIYVGIVYFSALVIYMWLKSRESRRKPPVAGGPVPPGSPWGSLRRGSYEPGKPAIERSCPSCGAVVYPEEKACWKCGTSLPNAAATTPAAAPPGSPPLS